MQTAQQRTGERSLLQRLTEALEAPEVDGLLAVLGELGLHVQRQPDQSRADDRLLGGTLQRWRVFGAGGMWDLWRVAGTRGRSTPWMAQWAASAEEAGLVPYVLPPVVRGDELVVAMMMTRGRCW